MAHPAIDTLRQAIGALADVAAVQPLALNDEDLCAITALAETAGRLIDSTRLATAAEIEDRSRFELGSAGLSYRLGHRRGVHLVERLTRVAQVEAARRIRVGTALRSRVGLGGEALPAPFPQVAAAVADGTLGVDAAAVVTRCLSQADRDGANVEHLEAAERALVEEALREPADNVAVMARLWREALDPDGAEPREEKLRQQRRFSWGRERDGMFPFHGLATGREAAELQAAIAEALSPDAAPRFLSEEDAARGTETIPTSEGETVVHLSDPRTRDQKQYDLYFGLVRAGMRSKGQRSTATVLAVVTLDDLQRGTGVGWLDAVAEPVSGATIGEMVCDSGFRKIVLAKNGEVLALGRLERCFSYIQKSALAARDGGCVWPGCNAPPALCDAHHVIEWVNGGLTDVDNGVLLCPAHHHMLHASDFAMKMIDGLPHLRAPLWLDPAGTWERVGRSRLAPRLVAA